MTVFLVNPDAMHYLNRTKIIVSSMGKSDSRQLASGFEVKEVAVIEEIFLSSIVDDNQYNL